MHQDKTKSFHGAAATDQTADTSASVRGGGNQEQCSDLASGTEAPHLDQGAPPSNTAPPNCNTPPTGHIKVLLRGIDSLYLSYPGMLYEEQSAALSKLKEIAQSAIEIERASTQYRHGDHLFEVRDKGAGRHPYVLADPCYRIQVAGLLAKSIPLAYVQIRSHHLLSQGVQSAVDELSGIIHSMGEVSSEPTVSRADLYVDFICDFPFESLSRMAWVCRALDFNHYWSGNVFTGFSFGKGDINARLYNKTKEIKKSGKDYMKSIWTEKGWQEGQTVWRLEFELKRSVLGEHQVTTLKDLLNRLGPLWIYATTHWLKLTVPSLTDATKSRWPMHPLWAELTQVDWGSCTEVASLPKRTSNAPSDYYLFETGLATITSFMARENIPCIFEASNEYIHQADIHHASKSHYTQSDLQTYAYERAAEKARKFNLPFSNFEEKASEAIRQAKAEAYRKAKDGE